MSHENNEEYWFRYLDAKPALVEAITGRESRAEVRKKGERSTVSFPLNPGESYEWISEINDRFNLAPECFGVFVSLLTEYDSEIVTLPRFVVDLVQLVGGRVEFSVTFVMED